MASPSAQKQKMFNLLKRSQGVEVSNFAINIYQRKLYALGEYEIYKEKE